jgi:DNA-binding response OmpR family regulator
MAVILIIEDDNSLREVLCHSLSRAGHSVIEAQNGKAGLKLYDSIGADLLITDMIMPEMEGCEVLMALHRKNPSLKIIAISGGHKQDAGDVLHMATLLGASKVLRKPFSYEVLIATVNGLLEDAGDPVAVRATAADG